MEAAHFLETAESLADGHRESDWRSSVSRAYYSSYNTACELVRKGIDARRLRRSGWHKLIPHSKLSMALKSASDKDVSLAGKMLGDLCEERRTADYKLRELVENDKAREACVNAQELNAELEELGPARIAPPVAVLLDRS